MYAAFLGGGGVVNRIKQTVQRTGGAGGITMSPIGLCCTIFKS